MVANLVFGLETGKAVDLVYAKVAWSVGEKVV